MSTATSRCWFRPPSWQGHDDDASGAAPALGGQSGYFCSDLPRTCPSPSSQDPLIRKPSATPYFVTITISDYSSRHYAGLPFAALIASCCCAFADSKQAVTKSKKLLRATQSARRRHETAAHLVHLAAAHLVRGDNVYVRPATRIG